MSSMTTNNSRIQDFIISQVEKHPSNLVSFVAKQFDISRQRAYAYVAREIKKGVLLKIGKTRSARYFLIGGKHLVFDTKIVPGLNDDKVWFKYVRPMVAKFPENIQFICSYGFTEIFNNAIEHSEGSLIYTEVTVSDKDITFIIIDNGVGIFQKIQNAMHLDSKREAILHLSKGKFTTDPSNHTGEGIFFTSRAFNAFSIFSDSMYYTFSGIDWLLSPEKKEIIRGGTGVRMVLSLDSKTTMINLMNKYKDSEIGFGKTTVAVALSANPGDPHVSRSQAKRLLMGLEKFKWVILDFKGVESVGQAFVDEVFRVFKNEHPGVNIRYFNENKEVSSMIKRGLPKK